MQSLADGMKHMADALSTGARQQIKCCPNLRFPNPEGNENLYWCLMPSETGSDIARFLILYGTSLYGRFDGGVTSEEVLEWFMRQENEIRKKIVDFDQRIRAAVEADRIKFEKDEVAQQKKRRSVALAMIMLIIFFLLSVAVWFIL